MLKLTSFIAAILALAVVNTASAETLRVAFSCDYPPFNYRTGEGSLQGYDVDVARGVLGLIGADLEEHCQQWDGMIPSLLANKYDLIIASMSITDKRLKKMDFSNTYRISVGRLVGRKNSGWTLFDDNGDPIPANFAGLKVGVERATTYSAWFEAELPEADVVLYDSNEAMYLDLTNGRTDMIITNPMKAYLRFLSGEEGENYEFVSPQIDERKYFGIGVGIGLRQGNDELKARLNAALKTLTDDGWLEKYALKYFPFAIHK
jgi:polar amino acid transport system substrate-binding protein